MLMIEQYIDTKRLLADYNENKRVLQQMRDEYNSTDGTKAIDYSYIPSGAAADIVLPVVDKRLRIRAKIEDFEQDFALIDKCISALDSDEQAALRAFFMTAQSKAAAVEELRKSRVYEEKSVIKIFYKCISALDSDEQAALRAFFMTAQSKAAAVEELRKSRVYEEKSVIKIFYDNDWG